MHIETVDEERNILTQPSIEAAQSAARTERQATRPLIIDTFEDTRKAGSVVGSQATNGGVRLGADVERVLSIDNGALRIQPLLRPGWGKSGIVYGPFKRQAGLAFAAVIINGHGASETTTVERLRARLGRWSRGSETEPRSYRLRQWLQAPQRRHWPRLFHAWVLHSQQRPQTATLTENLAVGWFSRQVADRPLEEGANFVVHSSGPNNADLWARTDSGTLPAIHGLQAVPVVYIVVLREQGAAYYAASLPGAHGLAGYPMMRPLAIKATNDPAETQHGLYAGLYQSALGQIGFRAETRVTSTRVAHVAAMSEWFGTAHVADRFQGAGMLAGTDAEIGGTWAGNEGQFERTPKGLVAHIPRSTATLPNAGASGLVHVLADLAQDSDAALRVIWRWQDADNHWSFLVSRHGCQLQLAIEGMQTLMPASNNWKLLAGTTNAVQILDNGTDFSIYVNGQWVFGSSLHDERLAHAGGIGIGTHGAASDLVIHAFEAHPRSVPIPHELDCGPLWVQHGTSLVAVDDFNGEGDLAGHQTERSAYGTFDWERTIGDGRFIIESQQVRVQASLAKPNPNRTAYTIAWPDPDFADLQVRITPPGRARGGGERGRGGTIFWQDPRNYITFSVYVDDWYGTSIAAFFYLNGYEELYDAVWSNVGSRIYWGQPYDFRSTFDGSHFCCFVNGEPVLYRALTDVYPEARPLAIRRVGLVANWEWGNDTGSRFATFRALRSEERPV